MKEKARFWMALEKANGRTFASLGKEIGYVPGYIHQQYKRVLFLLGLPLDAAPQEIGYAIRKHLDGFPEEGTPEWMYEVIEGERQDDMNRRAFTAT